jgi:hypothetical protein
LLKAQHLKVVSVPRRFGGIDSRFAKTANAIFPGEKATLQGVVFIFSFRPAPPPRLAER